MIVWQGYDESFVAYKVVIEPAKNKKSGITGF